MSVRARGERCLALLVELSRYLDGELNPDRCRQIERHLESCPSCTATAVSLRETMAACRTAPAARLPPSVRRRARARIKMLLDE